MKPYVVLFATLLPFSGLQAQRLTCPSGDHYKITKMKVYDQAKLAAFYRLKFRTDSTRVDDYTQAQTVLMISDRYVRFGDFNHIRLDSINNYLAANKKNRENAQARAEWDTYIHLDNYHTVTLTDLTKQETTVQLSSVLRGYEYTYPTPEIQWQRVAGDTVIQEMPCHKATCSFSGRQYVAWYTEQIPLPYGPYLFGGLPGLIVELHDVGRNWNFTFESFGAMEHYRPMYLYHKSFLGKLMHLPREKALTAYRNDLENWDNLFIEEANVKVLTNGKWVTPEANHPKRATNMLELVW